MLFDSSTWNLRRDSRLGLPLRRTPPPEMAQSGGSGQGAAGEPVIILSSSDEADGNLSLGSSAGCLKPSAPEESGSAAHPTVIHLSSSCDDEPGDITEAPVAELGKRKKRKKKKKKKVDVQCREETQEIVDSVVTEVTDAPDNVILRKLLRGPRYFDSGNINWETCYNCGEEGHKAADCTMEKRQKPCFVCGLFGHNARQCVQASKRLAKGYPETNKMIAEDSKICLWCGGKGHDLYSCCNGYDPDDLKEIRCYICKSFGHLCCVDFVDSGPREVACYNCALFGHTGLGCAKSRGESIAVASPTLCYKCGEEGHFARGCTTTKNAKSKQRIGESPTSDWKFSKEGGDSLGSRSEPRDFWGEHNKRSLQHEDRWHMTAVKSRPKGGWSVNDSHTNEIPRANGWIASPSKHRKRGKVFSSDSREGGDLLGPRSVPHDFWRKRNRRSLNHVGRWNMTAGKSRPKGGWSVDDPDDWPNDTPSSNGWAPSPSKHRKRHKVHSQDSGGHHSHSPSYRNHKRSQGTSPSQFTSSSYHSRLSRFGDSRGHSQRF